MADSDQKDNNDSSLDDLREARHEKDEWDKQIEKDAKAGRLDEIVQQAREDYEEGRTRPLSQL